MKENHQCRLKILNIEGKEIILIDYSHLSASNPGDFEIYEKLLFDAQGLVCSRPPKSVLMISDFTGVVFCKGSDALMKKFSASVTPFVKCSVVVGATSAFSIVIYAIKLLTRRDIQTANSIEDAKKILLSR